MAKRTVLLGKRLAVLVPKPVEKSEGGIVIPDSAKERKSEGTIVKVGHLVDQAFEVGDVVTFLPFGAVEMEIAGQMLTVVDESDVVSVTHIE